MTGTEKDLDSYYRYLGLLYSQQCKREAEMARILEKIEELEKVTVEGDNDAR